MSLIRSGSTAAEPALGLRRKNAFEESLSVDSSESADCFLSHHSAANFNSPLLFTSGEAGPPATPAHDASRWQKRPSRGHFAVSSLPHGPPGHLRLPSSGPYFTAALHQDDSCDAVEQLRGLAARPGCVEGPAWGEMLTCIELMQRGGDHWRRKGHEYTF